MNEIWLVRHGATEWTGTHQHTGRTDIPLTADGRREAAALVKPLNRQLFTAAFASPLSRAYETAKICGFADAVVLDDLREWDYGVYEGRTTAEIRTEVPDWSVWKDPVLEGESLGDVAARAARVLDRCATVDGRVLLFAHAHILRILAACAVGLPPTAGQALGLDPGSISVLDAEHDYRVIRRWNWLPN
ncbi:MAG: histidine phosphatase family protein [Acidimicrobiia bacterium]